MANSRHHSRSAAASTVVITGVGAIRLPPGAPLQRERWAGNPARLGRMDCFSALALCAADEALLDAGVAPLDGAQWDGDRTGVVVGTQLGCHAVNEEYYRGLLAHGPAGASPRAFAYTLPSSPLGEISIHYGARGPASTLACGGTAALAGLEVACADLTFARADRVLLIAVDSVTPLSQSLLSIEDDTPWADLAACWVLERAGDAANRGAVPRASVGAVAARFVSGWRATAVGHAAQAVLGAANADVPSTVSARLPSAAGAPSEQAAVDALWGTAADTAAARAVGVPGATHAFSPRSLAPAPLDAVATALRADTPEPATWLVLAGDAAGAGAAALLSVG